MSRTGGGAGRQQPERNPATRRPTLRLERKLMREHGWASLAALDEVGRGALCGPASVGAVLITDSIAPAPAGVRDAKLLSRGRREQLAPAIRRWAPASAVGHASSSEIDAWGIIAALQMAALRALAQLPMPADGLLLDGNHDYVGGRPPVDGTPAPSVPVVTVVRADVTCAAVAAASILAKTTRDELMVRLAAQYPAYGWADNSGYAAPHHRAAIARHGLTPHHRRSWNLPGPPGVPADAGRLGTVVDTGAVGVEAPRDGEVAHGR